jgi:hypothetical protein
VYRPVGANGGGLVGNIGRSFNGSPLIVLMILNLLGSSPITGFTLSATGLYFFFVANRVSAVVE